METRKALVPAVLVALAGALVGCFPIASGPDSPSPECRAAFDKATASIRALYETHPFYGSEYDHIYEDGAVTEAEQKTLDAMMADEEEKYEAIIDPLYDACDGVEDFYGAAYAQGPESDWSLHGTEAISAEKLKAIFVTTYCSDHQDRKACADYDPDDWQ